MKKKTLKNSEVLKLGMSLELDTDTLVYLGACLTCVGLNIDYTLDGEKRDEERVREELWKILDLFSRLKKIARENKNLEALKTLEELEQEINYV